MWWWRSVSVSERSLQRRHAVRLLKLFIRKREAVAMGWERLHPGLALESKGGREGFDVQLTNQVREVGFDGTVLTGLILDTFQKCKNQRFYQSDQDFFCHS
ncbi:unnamed protein product [Chondrus crispus]|uniref:Uncharacterized protein n=1 Tax=Chondrus crispus TaxID=2769 RepID=R7Q964_CHOCR|nr:unnamed protein product [Chondrus crispus]CDF33990.1 unnamed protein product [Chondrus crispus]|eukprot:XP_005713809.1 unnamed protein product [Chondrus crispus]